MTLNQLTYFEKIAETGNMGQAASLLHIAQPSLSISLSNLEKELNLTLFNRVGRKLILTSDGQQFFAHTKKILGAVQDAVTHMQSLSADRETILQIGCIMPALYEYLPRNIQNFLALPQNSDLKINFTTDNTSKLIPMLKDGYFDFLICSHWNDSELSQFPVISEPLVLLCPPSARVPETWDEILEQNLIGYHQRAAMHHELHSLLIQKGIQPTYLYRAPDEESIALLVEHGYGYAICPRVGIFERMKVKISPLPKPTEGFERKIYLTQLINRQPTGAAKRFLEYLKNNSRKTAPSVD